MSESEIVRPVNKTDPTYEEYSSAMDRLYAAGADPQLIQDVRTVFWYGWTNGYDSGKARQ